MDIYVVYVGKTNADCTGLDFFPAFFSKSEKEAMDFYASVTDAYIEIQPLGEKRNAARKYDTTRSTLINRVEKGKEIKYALWGIEKFYGIDDYGDPTYVNKEKLIGLYSTKEKALADAEKMDLTETTWLLFDYAKIDNCIIDEIEVDE